MSGALVHNTFVGNRFGTACERGACRVVAGAAYVGDVAFTRVLPCEHDHQSGKDALTLYAMLASV
jgi:hypothetical protein